MKTGLMLACAVIMWGTSAMAQEPWAKSACEKAEKQIVARFGEGERPVKGLAQCPRRR
jgi:hypothetical protein